MTPYTEPEWAEVPSEEYHFEIIKQGILVGKSLALKKSFLVAGRLPDCDLVIHHESASRNHAIIQYGRNSCYVYDLNSTHGTFINKYKIKPNTFTELKVGDTLRFGASTRNYVLIGEFRNESVEDRQVQPSKNIEYLQDPKRFLADFVSRNDAEVSIIYKETNKHKITAMIEIYGLKAEFTCQGSGKTKQEAEISASLEACHQLNEMKILDQSNVGTSESQTRKRLLEIIGDDEDDYLDKTKKQKQLDSVETFDSLIKKSKEIKQKLTDLNEKIRLNYNDEDEDEFDMFMKGINEKVVHEESISLQKQIEEEEQELKRVEKLLKIVKPNFNENDTIANKEPNIEERESEIADLSKNENEPAKDTRMKSDSTKSTLLKDIQKPIQGPTKIEMQLHADIENEQVIDYILPGECQSIQELEKLKSSYGY